MSLSIITNTACRSSTSLLSSVQDTACEVHTFDCTYNGTSLDKKRHTYHKICVGIKNEKRDGLQFMTLPDIIRSKMAGGRVDLLKVGGRVDGGWVDGWWTIGGQGCAALGAGLPQLGACATRALAILRDMQSKQSKGRLRGGKQVCTQHAGKQGVC